MDIFRKITKKKEPEAPEADSKYTLQLKEESRESSQDEIQSLDELQDLIPTLSSDMSDAGQFSVVAVCALCLRELFGSVTSKSRDFSFKENLLKKIVKHLKLPPQVETSGTAIMRGTGLCELEPFTDVLLKEKVIETNGPVIIPQDLVTLALREGFYDSRLRVLIRRISEVLMVEWKEVEDFEKSVVKCLRHEEHQLTEEEEKERDTKSRNSKIKRGILIGAATIGGGALIGLTGGLAAPLLAAGVGVVIGGAGAAALGSTAGVAIIGSLFGVAGAGLTGYKMKKRVGGVEEFEFEPMNNVEDMHVAIAVTGWLTEDQQDVRFPWRHLGISGEQYSLKFETQYLIQMGEGISYLLNFAVKSAASEALKYTVLSGILAAITWPATLLAASSIIDNPWSICTQRTVTAGKQLAEVLISRQQGRRPVTLVGYSLGARVIFYCLQELSKRKNTEGIIQDAYMLGAPVTGNSKEWSALTNVVAGRIVNGYCRGDWLLKFLYRTASVQISIAGLSPVDLKHRKMLNVDLTDMVDGHLDYQKKINFLLKVIGVPVVKYATDMQNESTERLSATAERLREAKRSRSSSSMATSISSDLLPPTLSPYEEEEDSEEMKELGIGYSSIVNKSDSSPEEENIMNNCVRSIELNIPNISICDAENGKPDLNESSQGVQGEAAKVSKTTVCPEASTSSW